MYDSGRCRCGKIEFSLNTKPQNATYCYCVECQKLTGSDKWCGVWVPDDEFEILKGSPRIYTRKGASGDSVIDLFCENCGTIFAIYIEENALYSVSMNLLNRRREYKPDMLIYTSEAEEGTQFPEGVAKFESVPLGMLSKKMEGFG